MRNLLVITVLVAMACLSSAAKGEVIWDFSYGYDDVYASDANDYDFSVTNALKYDEGVVSYYQPAAGNLNPAVIIKKFSFANTTEEANLFAGISTFKWWYGEGEGWVYASKNGSTWVELKYVGPPETSGGANYSGFNGSLPASVLGGTDLWVKVEINSTNTSGNNTAPFRNTAQHTRAYDDGVDSFTLDVNLTPEPATMSLLALGGLAVLRKRHRQ